MADAEKATLKKIAALVEKQRELQAQIYELTEEMLRLLSGDPGIGVKLKQLEEAWRDIWAARYQGNYVFQYVKDRPGLKRLLKAASVDEIALRMARYIRSNDQFFIDRRHMLSLFVSTFNQHTAPGSDTFDLAQEAPSDCRHDPPCRSDSEHTKRRRQELQQ
jgi:frataxin-like iron-binding protein CyaY